MKAADIRSAFLGHFSRHGHTVVESSSLVPHNDPTLLFSNAGMNQFKDVFLGKERRNYSRATSTQKCVRAGGKHNDLENVGFTARHHTFFEMLGNFSFGDYFKKDAIHYAWEFVTRELQLPKDRLYVTVFEKDDEAAEIWHKQEGVARDRIYRFGEKDNFWSMGDTGPCGPCTELFIDRGAPYGCGKPTCGMGCDCDRYMEFWNLVFMQFDRSANGTLTPLPKPSVDTGAGLERIASILQNVPTNYDTDLFLGIIDRTSQLAKRAYTHGDPSAFSFRVIADHSRATTFLIGDGVLPSNEGRGYVLRRIMRRAIRYGKKLGFNGPFLYKTCGYVIDQMKDAFPDLVEKRAFIEKAVLAEEEQFFRTLERGLALLDEEASRLASGGTLAGTSAFKLYDTFGFPLDLTRVILAEKNLSVDEKGFEAEMEKQREESRKHWKGSGEEAVDAVFLKTASDLRAAGKLPAFVGYDKLSAQSTCLGVFTKGSDSKLQNVDSYSTPANPNNADTQIRALFAVTPFYAESGGQVGDRGRVTGDGFEGEVVDVQKPGGELIVITLKPLRGTLKVGGHYLQETAAEVRALTARNHTATHLLHWALREVLGKHVKQAGSLVTPELLRFDFSHFQALTSEELERVETLINERIWKSFTVKKQEMDKDAAIAAGAIAFFGEKYGDLVRVVQVGDFSTELCGGTHVDQSGEIHLFKIGSESGIAAGVRRIIAYTSKGAFDYLKARDAEIKAVKTRLKASSSEEILGKLEKLFDSERDLKKQLEKLQSQAAAGEVDRFLNEATEVLGAKCVVAVCTPDAGGMKRLREMADQLKQKAPNVVAVLGMAEPDQSKAYLVATVGPSAPKSANAQKLVQGLSSLLDAKGGGKPDFAQAGGTQVAGLQKLKEQGLSAIQAQLKE